MTGGNIPDLLNKVLEYLSSWSHILVCAGTSPWDPHATIMNKSSVSFAFLVLETCPSIKGSVVSPNSQFQHLHSVCCQRVADQKIGDRGYREKLNEKKREKRRRREKKTSLLLFFLCDRRGISRSPPFAPFSCYGISFFGAVADAEPANITGERRRRRTQTACLFLLLSPPPLRSAPVAGIPMTQVP